MRDDVAEALAAATGVVNEWLVAQQHAGVTLALADAQTIKDTVERFLRGARRRRVSHWDWERKFYRRVRHRDAWIFDLRQGSQPVVLCMGTIAIREDHVTLEYLERRAYARVKGVALAAAYQFALAVANVLGLAEVRINDPINDKLARYYERKLEMTPVRHPVDGRVKYLYRRIQT